MKKIIKKICLQSEMIKKLLISYVRIFFGGGRGRGCFSGISKKCVNFFMSCSYFLFISFPFCRIFKSLCRNVCFSRLVFFFCVYCSVLWFNLFTCSKLKCLFARPQIFVFIKVVWIMRFDRGSDLNLTDSS